ncbi:MAG TPA: hypothetical protein VM103_01710 [Candidatus Paceibacterota bacterium]|nr:hypothetical protein [Candidatus Paceibacterota bacterium]
MRTFSVFLLISFAIAPAAVHAAGTGGLALYLFSLQIVELINHVFVPFIYTIGFVIFVWGCFKYFIYGADSEEERKKGRDLVVWTLVGFFLMTSLWGLVNILTGTLNFGIFGNTTPPVPTLPTGAN